MSKGLFWHINVQSMTILEFHYIKKLLWFFDAFENENDYLPFVKKKKKLFAQNK